MDRIEKWISDKLGPVSGELKKSLLFTYLWGIAAHGYMFMSNSVSHDSLDEFIAVTDINAMKIGIGRFLTPAIQWLRGPISAPWWVGILSLLYLSITLFLIVRMFDIRKNWMICLTAGMLVANISYTALAATYIHDIDCNSLAVLMAVTAVYLWRTKRWGFLFGVVPVALSLSLYQSFVAVAITLVIILSIMDLMNNQSFKTVFCAGLCAALMVIVGAVLYSLLLKLVLPLVGIAMSERYNSVGNVAYLTVDRVITLMKDSWTGTFDSIIEVNSGLPGSLGMIFHRGILLICAAALVSKLISPSIGILEKLLLVVLFAFLPIGMDISTILADGVSHELMQYAFWLIYLLVLVLTRAMVEQANGQRRIAEIGQIIAAILVAATLVGNVQVANCVYTGKRFIQDANLSLFTRIVADIEKCTGGGYVPGQTELCFIGTPENALSSLPSQYERYYAIGFGSSYVMGAPIPAHYQSYFDYVLLYPAVIAGSDRADTLEEHPDVLAMPAYPQSGSIAMVDGTVVVKLGN